MEKVSGQPQLLGLLGESERQLGNAARSVELTRQALQIAPAFAEARYYLALALLDLGKRDEAIPEFEKLGKLYRILKIPADWLLDGDGEPPAQDELIQMLNGLDSAKRRHGLRFLKMLADDTDQVA